jgi:hypothetical protein|tara:strand:+ start:1795 stop:1971 length:177 start_codon:yes stop_codon:yes gene_type:complete
MSVKTNWTKVTSQNFLSTTLRKLTIPVSTIYREVIEQFSLWNDGNVLWQDVNSNWEDL